MHNHKLLESAVLRDARAGVHINGYVETPSGLELWVARRSRSKATWPGKLDHIVAGGQPAGMTCAANVIKACPLCPLKQQLPPKHWAAVVCAGLPAHCAAHVQPPKGSPCPQTCHEKGSL